MKFCRICKKIFSDSETVCPSCRKKLKTITDVNEPVCLAVVGGTERAMLTGLLKDADIPYLEQTVSPRGVNNDIITGYDVKLSNIALLVPFAALPKASELLSSIETVDNHIEPMLDEINADIEKARSNEAQEKHLSPALSATIKVVTAILFFILIAIVVFGTDKIMEWIMGLFH